MFRYQNKDIKLSVKIEENDDNKEKDSVISDEYINLEKLEKYNIILPDEPNLTLEDLDIGFI